MEPTQLLTICASLVAALFGVLSVVVGWIGSRVIMRLDDMVDKLECVKSELHSRINHIDIRLVKVETIVQKEKI